MDKKPNYNCENCKTVIPLPKKEIWKAKKMVLPKFCANCKIEAPRQSQRSRKERKK